MSADELAAFTAAGDTAVVPMTQLGISDFIEELSRLVVHYALITGDAVAALKFSKVVMRGYLASHPEITADDIIRAEMQMRADMNQN